MSRPKLSRKCKRRRNYSETDLEGSSKRLRVNYPPTSTYFETLVPELKDNVMRFTSKKPSIEKWQDYVGLDDVHNYLDEYHPFYLIAKSRFTALMAFDSYAPERIGLLVNCKGPEAEFAFRNIAHALKDLVTNAYIYQTTFPSQWRDTLRYGLPNLKSLYLGSSRATDIFPLGAILKGHSGKLKCLEMAWGICTDNQVRSMEKHLTGLRRLSIKFCIVPTSFAGIWKTVGNTLQEFSVVEIARTENYEKLALGDFRAYCRNIIKLSFELPPAEVRRDLVKLFIFYGEQLQKISLLRCGLGTEELRNICAACPTVEIDMTEYHGLSVESLIAIGKNASFVNLGYNTFDNFDTHKLREAGNVNVNLKGLHVSAYSHNKVVEWMNEVFKIPNPSLDFLRISNLIGRPNASVHDIVGKRFPALATIEILRERPSLSDLVKLGPKCPKLKELTFQGIFTATDKICNCGIQGKLDEQYAAYQLENIEAFIAAVHKFPNLDEVKYSCWIFDDWRFDGNSARVENVEQFLKLPGGKSKCLTICGNIYS